MLDAFMRLVERLRRKPEKKEPVKAAPKLGRIIPPQGGSGTVVATSRPSPPDSHVDPIMGPLGVANPLSPTCPYGVFQQPAHFSAPETYAPPAVHHAPIESPPSHSAPDASFSTGGDFSGGSSYSAPSSFDAGSSFDSGSSSSFSSGGDF